MPPQRALSRWHSSMVALHSSRPACGSSLARTPSVLWRSRHTARSGSASMLFIKFQRSPARTDTGRIFLLALDDLHGVHDRCGDEDQHWRSCSCSSALSLTFIVPDHWQLGRRSHSDMTKIGGWLGIVDRAAAWYASAAGVINETHGKVVLPVVHGLTSVSLVACHRTQPPTAPGHQARALLAFWARRELLSA